MLSMARLCAATLEESTRYRYTVDEAEDFVV
jgi:hypothetical protein